MKRNQLNILRKLKADRLKLKNGEAAEFLRLLYAPLEETDKPKPIKEK